jgi:hypothetical protein
MTIVCRALTIISAAYTSPYRLSAGANIKMREECRHTRRNAAVHHQPGGPHFPASVIDRSETPDERTNLPEHGNSLSTAPHKLPRIGYRLVRSSG